MTVSPKAPAPETEPDFYFVSRPDHFRVVYAINGHMHEGMRLWQKNADILRSGIKSLWRQGVAEITRHNGQIIRIAPDARCPDQVFAADPLLAFVAEDGTKTALMSKMRFAERQYEVARARQAAKKAGFTIIEPECVREGSGDTLFDPNYGIWFTGVGKRTEPGAGRQLSAISGRPVVEIPTHDEHFYHVDTFLSFLPKGHAIVYKDAMPKAAYDLIRQLYPDGKRLEIDRRAAMTFAANAQILTEYGQDGARRDTVVVPADTPALVKRQLSAWGYTTETIDIKAARRAGGGIHCCFQRVWDLRKYPLHKDAANLMDAIVQANDSLPIRERLTLWDKAGKPALRPQPPQAGPDAAGLVS